VTPNQKGAIAEAAITKVAVELGIIVSRPLHDAPYDLVFDVRGRLLRVQCK
jgi:PD-(D/E)XK nuclease superfamily protein